MDLPAALTRVAIPVGQCWLWRDGDEVTLVDSGPAGSGEAIAAALTGAGLDRDAVVRIVLAHFHQDHVGSAAEVRAWSGAEVVAHAADGPIVRGELAGPPVDLSPGPRVVPPAHRVRRRPGAVRARRAGRPRRARRGRTRTVRAGAALNRRH
jgi:glyoxylase-like metal-dependent hydrolase (beta-lactamase superfamily II)